MLTSQKRGGLVRGDGSQNRRQHKRIDLAQQNHCERQADFGHHQQVDQGLASARRALNSAATVLIPIQQGGNEPGKNPNNI